MRHILRALVIVTTLAASSRLVGAAPSPIDLWPGTPPGTNENLISGEERDITKPTDNKVQGKPVIRLGNVSRPTITIYQAKSNGAPAPAVLVCPGGGYHILAMDLEGTEVCEWLNSQGITAVLLKYRVPVRKDVPRHLPPLQDAQRALGYLRQNAKQLNIDPSQIGVLGFSAGGHLAAAASTNYRERTYPRVDAADDVSCRPDFAVLVYPGYLTQKDRNDEVSTELTITKDTPPTFLVMTQDDPVRVENALYYAAALKKAGVPMELHVYPTGGHGYGLRPGADPVTTWPARAADWLRAAVLKTLSQR